MTKLYRASRVRIGWLADVVLAGILIGGWFVVGTLGLAALHALVPDAERLPTGAVLFTSLALVMLAGIRVARSEAYEDGHADGRQLNVQLLDGDEIPF